MSAKLIPENVVISDATVLINFLNTGNFQILLNIFDGRLHITDIVLGEIKLIRSELDEAIKKKKVILHKIKIDQVKHLVRSFDKFNPGEASCFVLAKNKSWRIATDDSAAKIFIKQQLNPNYIITTFDILLEGINRRMIDKKNIQSILNDMETKANFIYNENEYKEFLNKLANY